MSREPMTADRFHALYCATGLSVRDLAVVLCMTGKHADVHLREMLDGERKVPGPTGVALMALADGWRPGAWPDPHEIDDLLTDCARLAEHPNARPLPMTLPGCEPGGYNGLGHCFLACAAMLRRMTGRG